MYVDPEIIVETLGPCTKDVRDCEIMRSAIALQGADLDNSRAQSIRQALAKEACQDCAAKYLADLVEK